MRLKTGLIRFIAVALFSTNVLASGTLNLTEIMPPEFEFCGKKIGLDSPEYKALWRWFNNNTMGWYETRRDYPQGLVFTSQTMLVNMIDNKVVVRYAANSTVGQLVKAANTKGFSRLCP